VGKAIGSQSGRYDERLSTQGAYPASDDLAFVRKVYDWWHEADESQGQNIVDEKADHAFALGHQWTTEDTKELEKTNRAPLTINKTMPTLMVVGGHERGNRMRVRYLPVEQGDSFKAEIWSECARMVQEQGDIDFHKSDAFMDMLKGGRGFVELRVDFRLNDAGEIRGSRVLPWEVRIDPSSSEYDMGDARYFLRAKEVSYEVLLDQWPDKSEEILQAQGDALELGTNNKIGDRDSDYDSTITRGYDKGKNTWQLIEAWYWQVEKVADYRAQNEGGRWEPIKDKNSLRVLMAQNPLLQWEEKTQYKRQYYQAFVCGPVLLENNKSPYEMDGIPYIGIFGIKDEETGRYVGMVHTMRDPQMELNKRRTQVLHILNQGAKSGWYGPEGSFVDRDQWEEESAKPGVILEYAVEQGQQIPQPLTPPPLPSAFIQLEQMASVDLRDVSGVNIELMGLSQKDTPGIVTNQRQKQALTLLQNYFDNMRRSTKQMGRIILAMMQQYYTDGRQFEIPGLKDPQTKQPAGPVQMSEQLKIGRYDLIAEESPYSPNQKMETASKLMQIIQMALQAGIPIPPEVLDYMDLPETFTMKWKQMIQEKMEASKQGPPPDPQMIRAQTEAENAKLKAKMDTELHQLALQQAMADIKKTESETIKNLALAEAAELGPQMDQYKQQMDMLGQDVKHRQEVEKQQQEHQQQMMQADQQHQQQMVQQQSAQQAQAQQQQGAQPGTNP
jgi:hypothetical protein